MQVHPITKALKKATLGKGLQEENIQVENNSGELKVGIDIPLGLQDGEKHAPGKQIQRDAVRGIKLISWVFSTWGFPSKSKTDDFSIDLSTPIGIFSLKTQSEVAFEDPLGFITGKN